MEEYPYRVIFLICQKGGQNFLFSFPECVGDEHLGKNLIKSYQKEKNFCGQRPK